MGLNNSDYQGMFKSVCDGLGMEPNDKIVNKCYRKTSENMNIDTLRAIGKALEENSKQHPKYSDFIKTAFMCGFQFESAHMQVVHDCPFGLCNGSGFVSMTKSVAGYGFGLDFIVRCSCRLGSNKQLNAGLAGRNGNEWMNFFPQYGNHLVSQGYILKADVNKKTVRKDLV